MLSSKDSSQILCRYFKQGNCLRGSDCLFSHNTASQDVRPERACRYFLLGRCAYGNRCFFDHVKPPSNGSSAQTDVHNATTSSSTSDDLASFPTIGQKLSTSSLCSLPSPWTLTKTNSSQNPPTSDTNSCSPSEIHEFTEKNKSNEKEVKPNDLPLCPYGIHNGICNLPDCPYLHGELCDVCQLMILHPFNEQLRNEHKILCEQQFEEDLHYSFAVEASKDKVCGICLEVVLEKDIFSDRKFGILDCCDHIFCLKCIMSWRQNGTDTCSREAVKACPECRRSAQFIMKSDYWCDTPDAKKVLVDKWMKKSKEKPCKFWKSSGNCRFKDKCFFSHEGQPGEQRRRVINDRGVSELSDNQFDFMSVLLEAGARRGQINPSSLLFSLSDDDSDDGSLEVGDELVFLSQLLEQAIAASDNDTTASDHEEITDGEDTEEDAEEDEESSDEDEPRWLPGLVDISDNENTSSNTTGSNTGSSLSFNQPD